MVSPWRRYLKNIFRPGVKISPDWMAIPTQIDWKYKNTDGYLNLLASRHPATNLAYLVPHGNVRMEAMGLDGRPSTREDVAKMCEILERELQAGAFGLSTGLIYMPCAFGDTAEMIELCKVTAKYDGILCGASAQ